MKKALLFITALIFQIGLPFMAVLAQGESLFKESGAKTFSFFGLVLLLTTAIVLMKVLNGKNN